MLDVDAKVLNPSELIDRVARLVQEAGSSGTVAEPQGELRDITAAHANALHILHKQVVLPDIGSGSGPVGLVKRLTKRVTQKLTWWYMEPRWRVQRDFDAHAAHFASAVTNELSRLRDELESQRQHQRDRFARLSAQVIAAQTKLAGIGQPADEVANGLRSQEESLDRLRAGAIEVRAELEQIRHEILLLTKDFYAVRGETADDGAIEDVATK